ncbi:MAG: sigma-70 family RNA polymerase sigma factor [bacterium]|nr:sigma-70 family RNA polymerase sigma factor [bacterium]
MQDISDDILKQASKGDIQAFEEIYKAFSGFVYSSAFRISGNSEDAQEITQDVFFTAYKSLKEFRAESKLSTWLYRIAVNKALNFQRKKKLNQWLSLDFLLENKPDEIPHSPAYNPLKELEKSELERIVQKAINTLPDNQRVAIILSRYEALPYEEIAKIMKCSISSVESYLFRAKQNLSKKLIDY